MRITIVSRCSALAILLGFLGLGLAMPLAASDVPAKPPVDPSKKDGAKESPTYGKADGDKVSVMPPAWKSLPPTKLTPSQLDALLLAEQKADQLKAAPLTSDEQFLRRVKLDLTGQLPTPVEIKAFVAEKSPGKRAALIDKLLASDDFNHHWARYWKETVAIRATEQRVRFNEPEFEKWLHEQIKAGKNWAEITRAIVTATGPLKLPYGPGAEGTEKEEPSNGATFVYLMTRGNEAINERAAETSRLFMGIQIQCAQCHDHPDDIWKQRQFHEFAAFFARTRDRLIRGDKGPRGIELASLPRGEHQMPDTKDPSIKTPVQPKFITGEGIKPNLPDEQRRGKLADFITSKDNFWFSAAFANRVWGELMGQSFYQPVDNLGPLQEATYPGVLLKLAGHFRDSNYDIKDLYRLILNTETYQRQVRIGESADKHLKFAANYPTRLRADALWQSLNAALGEISPDRFRLAGNRRDFPAARRFGFEGVFSQIFAFDPSVAPDAVEGTVPQALLLMNNPLVQNKIRANQGVLAAILRDNPKDVDAVTALYVKVLARRPTQRELKTALDYIHGMRVRTEGYEDLLWALINSAEFQTKR